MRTAIDSSIGSCGQNLSTGAPILVNYHALVAGKSSVPALKYTTTAEWKTLPFTDTSKSYVRAKQEQGRGLRVQLQWLPKDKRGGSSDRDSHT